MNNLSPISTDALTAWLEAGERAVSPGDLFIIFGLLSVALTLIIFTIANWLLKVSFGRIVELSVAAAVALILGGSAAGVASTKSDNELWRASKSLSYELEKNLAAEGLFLKDNSKSLTEALYTLKDDDLRTATYSLETESGEQRTLFLELDGGTFTTQVLPDNPTPTRSH